MVRKYIIPAFSYFPSLGFVQKPSSIRNEGISVMMRVKNEVDWIELSIRSIMDFADEIVIVDNGSTDGTTEIIQEMVNKHNKILYVFFPEENIVATSNIALVNTHYKWILRWDGDAVAKTSGSLNIMNLRERIMNLDKDKYYFITLQIVHLFGDLLHQIENHPLNMEGLLCTWSPKLKFIQKGRFEQLVGSNVWGKRIPLYYKRIKFDEIYVFHCDVKPVRRMLFRYFWTDWMELNDFVHFPTLKDYVKYRIKKDWNSNTFEEAERIYAKEIRKNLVPYDREKFGDYPELLKERLKDPKYKAIS